MDIRTAFLHGEIDTEVIIQPPPGLKICGTNEVLKLLKGLYGLKQSPKLWHQKWKEVMASLGFHPLVSDECVFTQGGTRLLICVDDIIITGRKLEDITLVKNQLSHALDVKYMGELKTFVQKIVVKKTDRTQYQGLIGCLLFLSTRTRPDISASVGILSRFCSDPNICHLTAVKRILRYLKGTADYVLYMKHT